jgi:glycolate oxidase iron-sulfur subunit
MEIEEKNAKEEIIEIVEKCIKCGLCKELCPVFRVLREEQSSPRGHAIMLSEKIYDSLVFDCSLCKACEEKCPLSLKICVAIKKARQVLNLKEKQPEKSKELIKKILEKKNPYKD